jgi:c-di-GMP-binding flagellar brake protein YcgR
MLPQAQERRKGVRFNAPFPVDILDAHSSMEVSGAIQDLSYTGAKVLLDNFSDSLLAGDIFIFIRFPEGSLKVNGRVIWSQDAGEKKELGLSFLNIRDQDKEIIYNRIFKYYRQEFIQRWWQ